MSFLQLVRREMHGSLPKLLFMSGLGGISTATILASINAGMQGTGDGNKPSLWAATLFMVSLFLFIKTQLYVTITATAEIEAIIHKLRLRVMDQVRRSELLAMEEIGRSRIVAAITSDTAVLTQASNTLSFTVQGAVLIFFVGIYVAYLSFAAFAMTRHYRLRGGSHIPRQESPSDRREAGVGAVGTPVIRSADRLPGWVQGGEAQPRTQRRFVRRLRRRVANRRQHQNTQPGRNLQADRVVAGRHVCIARRCRIRGSPIQRYPGRRVPDKDHDGPHVRCRGVFRSGAIDTDLADREFRGGPNRSIGNRSAGDRCLDRGARH